MLFVTYLITFSFAKCGAVVDVEWSGQLNEGAAKYRYGIGTLHVRALMARTGAFSNRAIVAEKWVCVTVEKYDQSEKAWNLNVYGCCQTVTVDSVFCSHLLHFKMPVPFAHLCVYVPNSATVNIYIYIYKFG